MATVNRYTQTKDSIYQPQTLQELMVAPAYKRGKHDELDASIAEYETELAKYDSLAEHSDILKSEQDKLYQDLISQRDKLNNEGFSKSSKSDFFRFNKNYQSTVGPQGSIGQIQKAMKSYKDFETQMLSVAAQQGHDVSEAQKRLAEQRDVYKNKFLETGRVEDFSGVLPPSYHDLEKDIKDVRTQLGYELKQRNMNLGDYDLKIDYSTGIPQMILVDKNGNEITKNNNDAIANAETFLFNKWLNKEGDGYQSAVFNGMDTGNIETAIKSGLGMQRISEDIQDINKRVSSSNLPTPPSAGSDNTPKVDTKQRVTADYNASSSFLDAQGIESLDKLDEVINQLNNGTEEDKVKARNLQNRKHIIEQEYRNNPNGERKQYAVDYDNVVQDNLNAFKEIQKRQKLYNYDWDNGKPSDDYIPSDIEPVFMYGNSPEETYEELNKSVLEKNVLIEKQEDTGKVTIYRDDPGSKNTILMVGDDSLYGLLDTMKDNSKIVHAYKEGLNEKLKYEKSQDVKSNVTTFDNPADRTRYNTQMMDIISLFPNSFEGRIGYLDTDGSGQDQAQLNPEALQSVLDRIADGDGYENVQFNGFIMSTENGVPAIEVKVTDENNKKYTVQYELTNLGSPAKGLRGAVDSILDTFEEFGGVEGTALKKKFQQSIAYKNFPPTFFEDDFSNSQKIKNQIIGRVSTPEELEANPNKYTIADILDSNGLLSGDIDIQARSYNDTQYYSAKVKDPINNKVRNLTYGDLIPKIDGEKSFSNISANTKLADIIIPAMQNKLLSMGILGRKILPDGQNVIIEQVRDITDAESEELMNILNNSDIQMDNHYDILDILKQI